MIVIMVLQIQIQAVFLFIILVIKKMAINIRSQQVKRNQKVAAFLTKTYSLLNAHNNDIVRWGNNGIGFVIVNQRLFQKEVLPKYFKHSNYSSFVRQLNMYNFHKIRQNNTESYFIHQCFSRDDQSKLAEIRRKPERKNKYQLSSNTILRNEPKDINQMIQSYSELKDHQGINEELTKNGANFHEMKPKEGNNLEQDQLGIRQLVHPAGNYFYSYSLMPQIPTFCLFF